jgi:Na+/H+ antiporter NhaD/arsenite permease-like protein
MEISCFAEAKLVVSFWSALPFILFLLAIAILPVRFEKWWHHNKNKLLVSCLFSIPVLIFLWRINAWTAIQHAGQEYIEFMVMLGSLYVISGGIALTGDLKAKPTTNLLFLLLGALLANVIGTTGASMLLIRPLLKTNQQRKRTFHIPIFFIFIVSNTGGLLTPLGDPPLFLGFIKGISFVWTFTLWKQWLLVNSILLLIFLIFDIVQYRKESAQDLIRDDSTTHSLKLSGAALNIPLMIGVIAAILAKKLPIPFPFPELAMIACSVTSFLITPKSIHSANRFQWAPILEVAVLFAGIFICMIPALALIEMHGRATGISEPWQYFWMTGLLSSALDNAPTYLAMGTLATQVSDTGSLGELALHRPDLLAAVSCGAVFMGANSYIGNGPNFMVKAIAEDMKYKMPSFFGYTFWAILVLIPLFTLISIVFFRV